MEREPEMRSIILSVALMFVAVGAWADIDMDKIAMIESSGNPNAYNGRSGAIGLYQITKICLDDYNLYNAPVLPRNALWRPEVNEKVAQWYMNKRIPQLLRYYGHADTIENRIIAWNAGIKYVGKNVPRETLDYIKKYIDL